MKKVFVVAVVLLVIQKWGGIWQTSPSLDYSLAKNKEVVLYSASWCGHCEDVKEFLDDNHIYYQEFDIDKSKEGRNQFNKLGGRGVPLLLIDGETVRGYNLDRIVALLNRV